MQTCVKGSVSIMMRCTLDIKKNKCWTTDKTSPRNHTFPNVGETAMDIQHQLHIPENKENFRSKRQRAHPIIHVKKEKKRNKHSKLRAEPKNSSYNKNMLAKLNISNIHLFCLYWLQYLSLKISVFYSHKCCNME